MASDSRHAMEASQRSTVATKPIINASEPTADELCSWIAFVFRGLIGHPVEYDV